MRRESGGDRTAGATAVGPEGLGEEGREFKSGAIVVPNRWYSDRSGQLLGAEHRGMHEQRRGARYCFATTQSRRRSANPQWPEQDAFLMDGGLIDGQRGAHQMEG